MLTLAERFEEQLGYCPDPNGPPVVECECGAVTQYWDDHDCYVTEGEVHTAFFGGHGSIEE